MRLVFLGLLSVGCAHAAGSSGVTPERARIDGEQALAHVKYLASDELEGRGVKTAGIRKAAEYIAAQFQRDGLTPLGDSGTYLQSFSVPTGGKIVSGELAFAGVSPLRGRDFIVLGWSASTEARAQVVFAGFGVTDPEHHWDDYEKLDATGKIVLVVRKLPEGKELSERFADVREKIGNAKKHGAIGFILVNRPQDDDDFMRVRDAAEDKGLLTMQLRRDLAEKMLGMALGDALKRGPGLAAGEATLRATVERNQVQVANVVGLVRGSDPALAKEYVVVGAHYDHLGRGFPQAWNPFSCKNAHEGLIFHGADDNASGTSGMMEIAEAFAGEATRPRRSLVFVAFVGEEMGLLGSRHFVEHPPVPMDAVSAMVNLDMIGRLREKEGVSVEGSATAPQWAGIVERANVEHLKVTGSKALMEDSDHASFYRKDRPVIFFFTGLHPQYHCYTDTAELINGDGIAAVARLAYRVAREVADAPAAHAGLTFAKVQVARRGAGGMPGPKLGIAPDYTTQGGLGVAGIIEGGAAAKAGLKVGDLITMLGGKEVSGIEDYMAALGAHKIGDVVDVVVRRDGRTLTLKATLEGTAK